MIILLKINITNCCLKQFSLNANCKQMPLLFCSTDEVKSKLMLVLKFGFIPVETSHIAGFVTQASADFGICKFYCLCKVLD